MKVKPNGSKAIHTDGLVLSDVGIKADKADRACEIMWELYNDKALAAIRETIANAMDEHQKHKINRPVEISLLKEETSGYSFKVRDFALGLCEEDVRNVFAMLFESTKDSSDSFTGGFGVGAKAPFCVTDNFQVTSFFDGVKTVYSLFKTTSDAGYSKGQVAKIHEEETKESGIEVCIPVSTSQYTEFDQKIKKFVDGVSGIIPVAYQNTTGKIQSSKTKEGLRINDDIYIQETDEKSAFGIRMGHIVYPFPSFIESRLFNNLRFIPIIDVPVGYLVLAISREGISDTPRNRQIWKGIEDAFKEKEEEVLSNLEIVVEKLTSYYYETGIFKFPTKTILGCNHYLDFERVRFDDNNKKNIIVLTPNNAASQYWKRKLRCAPKEVFESGVNYFRSCDTSDAREAFKKVKNVDKVISIKSLKFPKEKSNKSNQSYCFYYRDGRWGVEERKVFTLSDFEQHILSKSTCKKPEEAKSIEELKSICIAEKKGLNYLGIFSCCKTAYETLIKRGVIFDWNSDRVKTVLYKLEKERKEKQEFSNFTWKQKYNPVLSGRTLKKLNYLNKTQFRKLQKALDKIQDNSLRGKFLALAIKGNTGMTRKEIKEVARKLA